MNQSAPDHTESQRNDDAFLITWLCDRDAACPLCGYNLRRLTSPRCPECGEAVQLSVSLVEPYYKAWLATVVGLLLPAGVGLLFIVVIFKEGWPRRMPIEGLIGFLYLFACIPVSLLAVTQRRWFLRLHRPVQHSLAAITWIALLIALISLLLNMR